MPIWGDAAGTELSLAVAETAAGAAVALGVGGTISGKAGKCSLLMLGTEALSEAALVGRFGPADDAEGVIGFVTLAVGAVATAMGVGRGMGVSAAALTEG